MKKTTTLSVRLPIELRDALEKAANQLHLSSSDVAKEAIRAAVEAIEDNNYRIHWPMCFELGDPSIPRGIPKEEVLKPLPSSEELAEYYKTLTDEYREKYPGPLPAGSLNETAEPPVEKPLPKPEKKLADGKKARNQ